MLSRYFALFTLIYLSAAVAYSQDKTIGSKFRVMEYNVENLFDCQHDSLKQDYDFTPEGSYKWNYGKYWSKLNRVARGIVLANTRQKDGVDTFLPPDIIGLCEVENDSTLVALTKRSLLRGAGYEYVMTDSPDRRGVDVALLYQPVTFRPVQTTSLRIDTLPGMRPTRDILYVKGETLNGFLHVFVIHAPSRSGGEPATRPNRMAAAKRLMQSVDSINACEENARILVMGDFNDYSNDASLKYICTRGMNEVLPKKGENGVNGTYRYRGEWDSLDHVFVSPSLLPLVSNARIADHPELLEPDDRYGGVHPRRTFRGPVFQDGYSDHLPLVLELSL